MKKNRKSKKVLFNAALILLTDNCSYDVFQEDIDDKQESGTYKIHKYDLQFVHALQNGSNFRAVIYDHHGIEYLDHEPYFHVGLSIL